MRCDALRQQAMLLRIVYGPRLTGVAGVGAYSAMGHTVRERGVGQQRYGARRTAVLDRTRPVGA
jgi:hypothetical protein